MNLITVILLLIAIWVFYRIYQAYNDIVSELKQIKMKCVKEGLSTNDAIASHISDNYTTSAVKDVRDTILSNLKGALEKVG
jgi:hypothetical protein